MGKAFKQPVSVLVVIYRAQGEILLLERADKPGFWQSVTGSREGEDGLVETACREVAEETGIRLSVDEIENWHQQNVYEIYPHWRHRYAPGVTENVEHVFSCCVSDRQAVSIAPGEHLQYAWHGWQEAASKVFSPSNAAAIMQLARRQQWAGHS